MSTSFHPETDGSSERSNKTVIESLRHYANVRQSDWADHLIHVETAMNNSINATTGMTPTELLYGTPVRLFPRPINTNSNTPAVTEFLERIQESIEIAKDQHTIAKTKQTTQANKHRREEPKYKVGDPVYLNTKNLRLKVKQKGRSAKLYPRWIGPFKILKMKPETSTYKLDLPPSYKVHPVFHARLIKLAIPNDPKQFPTREPSRPGPAFDDNDEEYEVEKILDHRDTRRGREFLVHWLGYPSSDDQWVLANDLSAPTLLNEYLSSLENPPTVVEPKGRRGARAQPSPNPRATRPTRIRARRA